MRQAVAVVVAAVALAVALVPFEPLLTNDGPQHFLSAWVRTHGDDPALALDRYFAVVDAPTSRGGEAFFVATLQLFPWRTASWLAGVLIAELFAFSVFAFLRALQQPLPVALLAFPLALNNQLVLGLFAYDVGMALGFLAAALLLRRADGPQRWLSIVAAAVVFYAAARGHVVAAASVGVVLFVVAAARDGARGAASAVVVGLPGVVVLGQMLSTKSNVVDLGAPEEPQWLTFGERVLQLGDDLLGGGPWAGGALLLSILVVAGWTLHKSPDRTRTTLAVLCVGLVLLTLIVPRHLPGWQLAGTRFIGIAVVCGLGAACVDGLPLVARRLAVAAAAAWSLASMAWFSFGAWRVSNENEAILEALDRAPPHPGTWLPVFARETQHKLALDHWPLMHVGQLVAARLGGASLFGQDGDPRIHSIQRRAEMTTTPLSNTAKPWLISGRRFAEAPELSRILSWAAQNSGVVVLADEPDLDHLINVTGYQPVLRLPGFLVADLVGCPVTVVLDNAPATASVELGYWPAREPARDWSFVRGDAAHHELSVDGLPCGPLWLRVDAPGVSCKEAVDGYVRATSRRGAPTTLSCTLP